MRERQSSNSLFVALQRLLPQHGLSRAVGVLAASQQKWLKRLQIRAFARLYQVDLAEAAQPAIDDYLSFNDFFTRSLKPGVRPLAGSDETTAVCPADGVISQAGSISQGRLLQAKGHDYSLDSLLGESSRSFDGGSFATIYLAPRDYHRVHLPVPGRLRRTRAIPGALFSVNATTEAQIDGLFARNERLVCYFDTTLGSMAVVLVGAMIVAGIETAWDGPASPYQTLQETRHELDRFNRGAEIGRFFLGSTVIVCLPPNSAELASGLTPGTPVRMGQALFRLTAVERPMSN